MDYYFGGNFIQSSFISYTWYMSRANILSINIQNKLRRGKKCDNVISWCIKKILIESCDMVNDIGADIHFVKHIDRILNKAYSHIGLLFRGFASRNFHVFRQAYITYIRPLLEYASNVLTLPLLMQINYRKEYSVISRRE